MKIWSVLWNVRNSHIEDTEINHLMIVSHVKIIPRVQRRNRKKSRLHINGGGSQEGDNSVGQELLTWLKNKIIKIYKTNSTYYYIPGFLLFGRVNLGQNILHSNNKICFSGDVIGKRNFLPLLYPHSHPTPHPTTVECLLHLSQEIPIFFYVFVSVSLVRFLDIFLRILCTIFIK